MMLAIADIKIRRDMYNENADVAFEQGDLVECDRLQQIAAELDDAIMILNDRDD